MGRYDVYLPVTTDALRPSAVQAGIVADMKEGAKLIGRFDVWCGYDWILVRSNGMTSEVSRATVQGLLNRGLITRGGHVSVGSGRQDEVFALTSSEAKPNGSPTPIPKGETE
jgi:hypothetical protein